MVKGDRALWKAKYFERLAQLLDEYPRCFIVGVDNVGSKQMQQIRMSLRDHAEILMGKNTMIRKVVRSHMEKNPALEKLMPHIKTNVGFVFTKEDLSDIRVKLEENKVAAPAKAGAIAPCSVTIPAQNTGLGPEKTSFFQALSIPTKITRGTIEILGDVPLIAKGDKVALSEATLLNMLKISPFAYGMIILQVYDNGSVYDPAILDITEDDMRAKFMAGVRNVAAVSLQIGYPTVASAPHSILNGFKRCLAVAVETDITFKQAEQVKEYLADPSKFAAASVVTAPAAATATKEEPKKVESESESDDDIGMGLFDE